jgi:hypothetical protein
MITYDQLYMMAEKILFTKKEHLLRTTQIELEVKHLPIPPILP